MTTHDTGREPDEAPKDMNEAEIGALIDGMVKAKAEAEGRPNLTRERLVWMNQIAAEAKQGHERVIGISPDDLLDLSNMALAHIESKLAEAPKEKL